MRIAEDYQGALLELMEGGPESLDLEKITDRFNSNFRWDREAKNNLRRLKEVSYSSDRIWTTQYRPYVKQHCYVEYILVSNKYKMDNIFPAADTFNRAICVPGVGSTKPFSALVVDTMPDLEMISKGQCFPRYRYEQRDDTQGDFLNDSPELQRIDNISDTALRRFRTHYQDSVIAKDSIFDYVYGILHAPDYREQFANDLSKLIPRVPMAPDFHLFAKAGKELAELHLGYETCPEYPLDVVAEHGKPKPEHYRIGQRKMRFADTEKTVLIVNDHIRLGEIPPETHQYEVNGRTPLDWFIDRYRITRDRQSGILNDPNGWFDDPKDLITAIRRIVYLSVETMRIVAGLPEPFEPEADVNNP